VAEDITLFGVSAYQQIRVLMEEKQEADKRAAEAGPATPLRVLSSTVQALRFVDIHDVSIFGFFDEKDEQGKAGFAKFASQSGPQPQNMAHALILDETMRSGFKVKSVPKVVMFKKGEKAVTFKGNCSDASKLAAWSSINGNIPVRQLDAQKLVDISSSTTPVVLFFYADAVSGDTGKNMLRELADEFTDVLVFYTAATANFKGLVDQFGLNPAKDTVVVLYPPKGHHYIMPPKEDLNSEHLRDYFNDYLADKVQRALRSEPAPSEPFKPGKVQVAVTSTLADIITDKQADVLVELCKPAMKDCALLATIMDSVAAVTENITTFKVVRINVDANEVNALFEIPHVPLLLYFPGNNKTGLSYDGPATGAKILEYVTEHAAKPFKVPEAVLDAAKAAPVQKAAPSPEEIAKIEAQAAKHVTNVLHTMQAAATV